MARLNLLLASTLFLAPPAYADSGLLENGNALLLIPKGAIGSVVLSPVYAAYSLGFLREAIDTRTSYKYPSKGKIEINAIKMGQCFAVEAKNSASTAYINTNEMQCTSNTPGTVIPPGQRPSVLSYLSGELSPCDLSSGTELSLEKWILKQKDNSIDPLKIFSKSLQLNHGNIWNAILAIHQIIRPYARWYDLRAESGTFNKRKRYPHPGGRDLTPEEVNAFFNKFIDIRGDLWDLDPKQLHGDHQGSWFRIWGAMLFQLSHLNDKQMNDVSCGKGDKNWSRIGEFISHMSNILAFYGDERVGKLYQNGKGEGDLGKFRTDMAGANAALYMSRSLANYGEVASIKDAKLGLPNQDECRNQIYLNRYGVTWDDVPFAKPLDIK